MNAQSILSLAVAALLSGLIAPAGSSSAPPESDVLVYFTADDGIHGQELWRSDGTEAGSVMVKDIRPGSWGSDPALFAVIDGRVFFGANDGSHGFRMWTSDGTGSATRMIDRSPAPVPDVYGGGGGAVAGGSLYFTTHGRSRIWVTDGTTAGTRPLHVAGGCLASAGGTVYFVHSFTTEIWRTDGTSSGTYMLRRIRHPSARSGCPWFTDMGGTMIYVGKDVRHGYEPWRSDGTVAGTTLVSDIVPGPRSSSPFTFAGVGERAFFMTGNPRFMWVTDGTPAGTIKLHRFFQPAVLLGGEPELGGAFYFTAILGGAGQELWKSDGTADGTVIVDDINPGKPGSAPLGAAVLDGSMFFGADDGEHGEELWRTDGTDVGTTLVEDINPGPEGSLPDRMVSSGGLVFFAATDGVHGWELWRTDGTASGTVMVKDINPGSAASNIFYVCAGPSSPSCHELR